jgi:uncharacterized protein
VARRLFVLLPPSESKEGGGTRSVKQGTFDGELRAPREDVLKALASLLNDASPVDVEKTLRVHGTLLERAILASRAVLEQRARYLPAWRRYNGVVWSHLDPATLTLSHRRRILVPSGLYGVTTAQDSIADYRLKMNAVLHPLGGLAAFWRPWLTSALTHHCAGSLVVNLLPGEHATGIKMDVLSEVSRVIDVRFLALGESVVAGHEAKAVKGVLARQIVLEGVPALESFSWMGWRTRLDEDQRLRVSRPGSQVVTVVFEGAGESFS